MKASFFAILLVALFAVAGTPSVVDTMKAEVAAGKAVLIDVREPGEWNEAHLKTAIPAPLSKLKENQVPPELKDKGARIYVHCRSGNRVKTAVPLLKQMGYTNVIGLSEGYARLRDLGVK